MSDWARHEVELAQKHENPDWDGESFDYCCSCYASALKAYESLAGDGHSGLSFSITKNILIRLMNDKPLTPIDDVDEVWVERRCLGKPGFKAYQCTRMGSLFKDVHDDGRVSFHDNSRYVCIDRHNPEASYTGGIGSKIIDEMFPITFPYWPFIQPYKIFTSDYKLRDDGGDFDTVAVWDIITPDGHHIDVKRYFWQVDGKWVEMDPLIFWAKVSMLKDEK